MGVEFENEDVFFGENLVKTLKTYLKPLKPKLSKTVENRYRD